MDGLVWAFSTPLFSGVVDPIRHRLYQLTLPRLHSSPVLDSCNFSLLQLICDCSQIDLESSPTSDHFPHSLPRMLRRASSERQSVNSLSSNHILAVLNTPTSISPSPEPTVPSSSKMVGRRSNVRRSPKAEIPLPVSYTPTTHRISKAKKGKRVHACEFPGCNKVCTV